MWMAALALGVALALLVPRAAGGQELRYWGLQPGQDGVGVFDQAGQFYSVRTGDVIPGVGTVVEVTDGELIVQRWLTDAEKAALQAQGQGSYDGQELHFTNVRAMVQPATPAQ